MTASFALQVLSDPYRQKDDGDDLDWLDRWLRLAWKSLPGRALFWRFQRARFVRRVRSAGRALEGLGEDALIAEACSVRGRLRAGGITDAAAAQAFAVVRAMAGRHLGVMHFDSQIRGAWVLLSGRLAEMETGEGKTLTATLAAATAALAGIPVHVVTVNDYLAGRDYAKLSPLYRALGLTTGVVTEQTPPADRPLQYRCDIVYCSNKTVVFDYLRDRHRLGTRMHSLAMALDTMASRQSANQGAVLRGLHFAIVDEADSVFVDEARTPLILSASVERSEVQDFYRQAVALASELELPLDAEIRAGGQRVALTEAGREVLATKARGLPPVWQATLRRNETVEQALCALHVYQRDVHYIVRDGKVQIVDENTGRVMADRSWERGLHQMIEIKEGLPPTSERETIARISYQLFFRRYVRLAGMTGTCREVAREVADVYGIETMRVPTRLPSRRKQLPSRIFASSAEKWTAVAASARSHVLAGQPVLIGTRSILASEALSRELDRMGIMHRVLNAKQDDEEARLVESAGRRGSVTIATSMAGRGTDIALGEGVAACGGLHVILTERHDNARVDRQLIGRCARQGDPGSFEVILSMQDELLRSRPAPMQAWLCQWLQRSPDSWLPRQLGLAAHRYAQWLTERTHAGVRRGMLRADFDTRRSLSFSGPME